MESNADLNSQLVAALSALKAGDFSARLSADQPGMTPELASTFNALVEQISSLTAEINRLSREMAHEGRFGGQAEVEGLSGEWKILVDNMNQVEGHLTGRIRAISGMVQMMLQGGRLTPLNQLPSDELQHLHQMMYGLARMISEQTPQPN
jgi:hypothetical protein